MPLLALLFIVVPALELAVLIQVGSAVGVFTTMLLVVATAVVGARLAQMQGLDVLRRIQRATQAGELPTQALLDGAFLFVAGAFLLTPGFITDTFGFLCLIPPARKVMQRWLLRRLEGRIEVRTYGRFSGTEAGPQAPGAGRRPRHGPYGDVLDVPPPTDDRAR